MKITIDIKKRDLYIIIGFLVLVLGGVTIYAYNPSGTGGYPALMGHDASEVGAGTFADSATYFFRSDIGIGKDEGKYGAIYLYDRSSDPLRALGLANDGSDFVIGKLNPSGDLTYDILFRMKNNGEVHAKSLCLNGDCKSSWPPTQQTSRIRDMLWCDSSCNPGTKCEDPATAGSSAQGEYSLTLYSPPSGCLWAKYFFDDIEDSHDLNEDNFKSGKKSFLCVLRC